METAMAKVDAGERSVSRWRKYALVAADCLAETVWPTRCVICERSGSVLCERCRRALPYIDQWMACPRCGAPYGMRQCTECNRLSLRDTGFDDLPFDACVSAALFSSAVARIVRTHKDGGERRLARDMAYAMACAIPSEWMSGGASVVPIPATREAQRSRGFDHGASLAQAVAEYLHAPCTSLLAPPHAKDQRELARGERFANMEAAFSLLGANGDIRVRSVILVDDVFTTGATLFAAASTLRAAGVEHVRCATFARVY